MIRGIRVAGLVVLLLATACSSGSSDIELAVDVQTDLRAGFDFDTVRVSLSGDAARADRQTTLDVGRDDDLLSSPSRVAEFRDLEQGPALLRVTLLEQGARRADRMVELEMQRSRLVRVVFARSCREVSCPAAADPATATQCIGGSCAEPACVAGDEGCVEPQCDSDGDCSPSSECAEGRCVRGVCLQASRDDECAAGEYCDPGRGCLPRPGLDGGVPDGGVPDGGCGGCDDDVECTVDRCGSEGCVHTPDDSLCTAGPGGLCDVEQGGCQYETCTEESCTAGPCQTAHCEGDVCVREGTCAADETCCGGACVPEGCDDGVACTEDACGADGCEHVPQDGACDDGDPCTDDVCDPTAGCQATPNDASCDDGTFCNGADTCAGGSCSEHGGDPCAGSTVCDEDTDTCTGCLRDSDCPGTIAGEWSSCDYTGTCDESAVQTRGITSYSCMDGSCVGSTTTESRDCNRDTDGTTCGSTTCDPWGACLAVGCSESGTQSRTCADRICSAGSCGTVERSESSSCTRDTDGTPCDDGSSCTTNDECSSGRCVGTDNCPSGCKCNRSIGVCESLDGDALCAV